MSESRQLWALHQSDKEIEEAQAVLRDLEAKLADERELEDLRIQLAAEQQKQSALQQEHKALEWDNADLGNKVKELEKKLYSGTVTSPKELSAMQKDLDSLKQRRTSSEEKMLGLMVQVDEKNAEVKAMAAALEERTADRKRRQEELRVKQAELTKEIEALKAKRREAATRLSPATLTLYETVKGIRPQAVAKVDRGMCQGCRLILPAREWHRVRAGALVRCSSCGRILCAD